MPPGLGTSRTLIHLVPSLDTPSSFPSGHAARLTLLSIFAALLASRRGLTIAAAAFVAFTLVARVYIGDHWPTGVIGGSALGLAFAHSRGRAGAVRARLRSRPSRGGSERSQGRTRRARITEPTLIVRRTRSPVLSAAVARRLQRTIPRRDPGNLSDRDQRNPTLHELFATLRD